MESKVNSGSQRNLYVCAVIVNIISFAVGTSSVWTSPALPRLKDPDSKFQESGFNEKWLVSSFAIGQIFGPLISGCFIDSLGRKPTTFIIIVNLLVSYALLAVAQNEWILYCGRVFGGFSFGMCVTTLSIYIAEISDASHRDVLNFVPSISRSLGYFTMYSIGPFLNYFNLILVSLVGPVMALLLFFLLPESPYLLFAKGQSDKAENIVEWLRNGSPKDLVQLEIDDIQKSINNNKKRKSAYRDLFTSRASIRALYISSGLLFFLQMSGSMLIMSIAEPLFEQAKINIPIYICTLTFGGLKLVAGLVGSYVSNSCKVKGPLVFSGVGMAATLGVFGAHFYLVDRGNDMAPYSWIPLVSLVAFICIYSIGYANRAYAVAGELFPPKVKALGSSLTNFIGFICLFLSIQLYYVIKELYGIHYGIWCFALINVLSIPFTIIFVPNTSGLSLLEIQERLNKPWFWKRIKSVPLEKITIRPIEEIL